MRIFLYTRRAHRGQLQEKTVRKPPKKIAVLVVDDEPIIRQLLAEYLGGEWDLDVIEAGRYGEAAEYIEAEPDLWIALVDCLVHPDGTVGPFYRRVKPVMESRCGTIIAMTGGNMRADEERMLLADNTPIIQKPWLNTEADVMPHIRGAVRKRWTKKRLEKELLPLLFQALLHNPEPPTPEEIAAEAADPNAWRKVLDGGSSN